MFTWKTKSFRFDFGTVKSGWLHPSATVFASAEASSAALVPTENVQEHGHEYVHSFLGKTKKTVFSWETEEYRLTWKIGTAGDGETEAVFFQAGVTNLTDHGIYLGSISLRTTERLSIACEGDPADWYLGNVSSLAERIKTKYETDLERCLAWGNPPPKKPEPGDSYGDGRFRTFGEFLTLFSRSQEKGLFISPVGKPEGFISSECFVEDQEPYRGEIQKLWITSEMSNVLVQPGETRWGQEIAFVYGTYEAAVGGVMHHLADICGSRAARPAPTGWCSWYDLASKITAESVQSTADALEAMKNRRPVDVIQVDDGFQVKNGNWDCNEKFPNGWSEFLETVNRAGAIAGIWLAPISVHDSTPVYAAHPEWVFHDKNGTPIGSCDNWGKRAYWLDVTHPDAYAFAVNVLKEKREQGFTYFKIDFNTVLVDGRYSYDSSRTRLQAYRDLYAGYRKAIGEDAYLCGCADFGRGTFGYVDSNRIGPDSVYVWTQFDPCNLRNCTNEIAKTTFTNGVIYANDPDVTYLYPKPCGEHPVLTWDEWQTWHTAVGLLGGTQMVSDGIANPLPQKYFTNLEILIPAAKEKAELLYPAADPKLCYFGMHVQRNFGNFDVVMVHNPADDPARQTLPEKLKGPFHVWSFWDKEYFGIQKEGFSVRVARHGCRLLRLTPVCPEQKLTLIGSDLHISQGAAELKNIREDGNTIEIQLDPFAGARDGALYFASEKCPESVSATGVENVGYTWADGVLQVQLKGRALEGEQKISVQL